MVAGGAAIRMNANLGILTAQVPWWGKIAAKVILARLPVDYKVWKRLHLFQQGAMEEPAYAYGVFKKHFDPMRAVRTFNGFVGLELGPGDSLLSAMVAHAFGASAYFLVDVGAFAQADLKRYRAMADFLADQGLPKLDADDLTSVEAMLAACRATYGTSGLTSLRAIPDKSVDFLWSHTVLQHIRRSEFLETMQEFRRVLRPDGISSHWVDLEDCLGGALNNLRLADSIWESPLIDGCGVYTNRIRYSEMLTLFKEAGFEANVVSVKHWDRLPTPRSKLCHPFRDLPEEELRVRCFQAILRPA
jgi:SAM-dependent methyltransferase